MRTEPETKTDRRIFLQVAFDESSKPIIEYRMGKLGCRTRAEYVRRCIETDMGITPK